MDVKTAPMQIIVILAIPIMPIRAVTKPVRGVHPTVSLVLGMIKIRKQNALLVEIDTLSMIKRDVLVCIITQFCKLICLMFMLILQLVDHCANLVLFRKIMVSVVVHVMKLHTKILLQQQLLASHARIQTQEQAVTNVLMQILVPNVNRKLTCS